MEDLLSRPGINSTGSGPQGPGHNLRLNCGKIKAGSRLQAASAKRQASSIKRPILDINQLTMIQGDCRIEKTNKGERT